MSQTTPRGNSEEVVLPHLDAAFNHARVRAVADEE
jgi:hypothetical protein